MKNEKPAAAAVQDQFPQTLPAKVARPEDFKAVKRLTRDLNTMTRLGQLIMCAESELYTIDMPDPGNPNQTRPVTAIDILDCLRGDQITLICGAVLHSTLKRDGAPLKDRYFAVRQGEMVPGKRYYRVEVVEIERAE